MFTPITITFMGYIFIMLVIGVVASLRTKSFNDYILGDRSLGGFVTAMSAGASDMSGWLLIGLPGAIYLSGLSESWIAVGLLIGAYCNWRFIAGRLRVFTENFGNSLTIPDFFFNRFGGNRLIKLISALIILFFFTIYCASGIVAGARLFQNLFGVSYDNALWIGAIATIIYTFIGGFLAISWTDTVQASLMIFALLITPVMVITNTGGFSHAMNVIESASVLQHKEFLNIFHGVSFVGVISFLAWGLGYFGQPHILARFMAAESLHTMRKARSIGMIWMFLCLLGAVMVGLFGIAYFTDNSNTTVTANSEYVFIELARVLFNPWISGVLLSAIFAAVMSTLSCQLLVSSSAITEDIYKGFINKNASQQQLVWVGRLMVLAVAIFAILIARNPESRVLSLVSYAWAGFGASFGPVVVFSLFWKRINAKGALAGMLVGALVVIVWKHLPFSTGIYEIIPGFILASIAIIIVSIFTKDNHRQVNALFDKSNEYYIQNK